MWGSSVNRAKRCLLPFSITFYHTLGALSTRSGQELSGVKRHPTICDHVTIYANSTVLGGETIIGSGVIIGGNAFITKSIPDYTKIVVKSPEMIFKNPKMSSGKWEI